MTACGGSSGSSPEKNITSFRGQDRDFYNVSVQSVRASSDLRAAALKHLGDKDPNVRFASFYALTLTAEPGPSAAALDRFLTSRDSNERLPAAGALVSRGQKEGIPVLIDALGSQEVVAWFDPPMDGWRYARFVLTRYTGQELGLRRASSAAAAKAARPAWQRWYAQNGSKLTWDPTKRRFTG